jgi:GAF domain-containing protein/HAMP domain-containing protein
MASSSQSNGFFQILLRKTGGWYILAVIALAQLLSFPAAALGVVVVQTNAKYSPEQLTSAIWVEFILLIIGFAILLGVTHLLTRDAHSRLSKRYGHKTLPVGTTEELSAWRQISQISWRFGAANLTVSALVFVLPLLVYLSVVQKATNDQILYTLMGSIVSVLSMVILTVLLIERMIIPARDALIPASFESQIAGAISARILFKFQTIILALIIISILLIAPLGYSMAFSIMYEPVWTIRSFSLLRLVILAISTLTIVLGFGLSFLLSRSVSNPVNQLIDVFQKVEQGDLAQRAKVISTDEIAGLTIYFNRMLSRLEQSQKNLESQVAERTAQLEATNEVGRVASSILDPDELISNVVNLVTDKFGYYYTALFIIEDSGTWAELAFATGRAGSVLKERHHRLAVASNSMVGYAITNRKARIALDVGEESIRFDNPLLPETRSEIALPLVVGDHVIGALDVQSKTEAAFDDSDIDVLQNMANQVAIAIENARLFQSSQILLNEMRSTNQKYLVSSWSEITRSTGKIEYQTKSPISPDEKLFTAEFPLSVRDQILGDLIVQGDEEWSADQKRLLEAVATQAAFALENARLLNESQQTALRERIASGITERIWSSQSIDGILQTAVRELGRALEASEATIELSTEEQG